MSRLGAIPVRIRADDSNCQEKPMEIDIVSFGYDHGIPQEADLLTDVRFLANPFHVRELKNLSGEDEAVETFVLGDDRTGKFLEKYLDLLDYLVPLYEKGRARLTIAAGCAGGKHRSVVIARAISRHFAEKGMPVRLSHRDLSR